ncbi:Homeobox protein Mohawk [Chionoecetes opilio]|uniref:Homeobox protein Mohawk n=1 Tax=Chionoecetes opilio TaxID=41210 RepID=A0A8J5CFV8_CHIOP|nr:Homeobox protein Mohawk [Chionoecetes opilio]
MGPIRAFTRPSLAAGDFGASASPYNHTPGFSAARRPCFAHTGMALGRQHTALAHPHLYNSICAADPLHAGLGSSPAAPPPCLFHFRILPPGAGPPDTRLAAAAHQDTGGAGQGATRPAATHERRKDIYEQHGWINGGEYECMNNDERKSKKKIGDNLWKIHKQENKCKKHGAHKRDAKTSQLKWGRFGAADLRKRNQDENKQKNKDKLKWKETPNEHHGVRSEEENESGSERREAKWSQDKAAPAASPLVSSTDDPCTPLSFPFSDDDDDDNNGREGKDNKQGSEELWPISDIVETEDEEGENQTCGHAQDTPGEARAPACPPVPAVADTAADDAECAAAVIPQPLPSTADDDKAIPTQDGNPEHEDASGALDALQAWQDSPPPEARSDLHKDSDVDDNDLEDQMEQDNEEKRTSGDEECPRDGVRVTPRLRHRSYRQFLLMRERRSRVFLKARSYHLGRWFVTHFTHPYPSKDQKDTLAATTSMTRNQVSEWFGNMRRRIREATRGLGVCWEERVRLYNTVITGKSEPLPILPGDAINTWVPPVAEAESPSLDPQEEVSASPKFKKALMQRYLNTSFESPPQHTPGGNPCPPSTPTSLTPPLEDMSISQGHNKSFESSKSSAVTPHVLPLCTSSPRESFQARWNTSFQHVKDSKYPAVTPRLLDKADSRFKFFGGRGQGEEEGRVVRKYERQRSQEYSSTTFKRQKTDRDPSQTSAPCGSSLPPEPRQASGQGWRALASTSTAQFQPSSWMVRRPFVDVRSSDEEGGAGRCVRKPEELAAAYTLMEMHTDATATHGLRSSPFAPVVLASGTAQKASTSISFPHPADFFASCKVLCTD